MATYLYEATDQKGRIIKGEITALTEEEVMTLLSAKNLIPKVIKLKKENLGIWTSDCLRLTAFESDLMIP